MLTLEYAEVDLLKKSSHERSRGVIVFDCEGAVALAQPKLGSKVI